MHTITQFIYFIEIVYLCLFLNSIFDPSFKYKLRAVESSRSPEAKQITPYIKVCLLIYRFITQYKAGLNNAPCYIPSSTLLLVTTLTALQTHKDTPYLAPINELGV